MIKAARDMIGHCDRIPQPDSDGYITYKKISGAGGRIEGKGNFRSEKLERYPQIVRRTLEVSNDHSKSDV